MVVTSLTYTQGKEIDYSECVQQGAGVLGTNLEFVYHKKKSKWINTIVLLYIKSVQVHKTTVIN